MRQRLILPALFAFLLAPAAARAATVTVSVVNFNFTPATVNIDVGDTVTWTGLGGSHNVAADNGSFRSGNPGAVATFSHKFTSAGSFGYHCEPHQGFGMVGVVNVAGGGGNVPTAPKNLQALAHSTTEVMLSWTDSSGETGYRIERKTLGGAFQEVATAPANSTSAIVGGLTEATFYTFRIRAENGAGLSSYSNEAGAATNATPGPCIASGSGLCLNEHFRVELFWRSANGGGPANPVPLAFAPDSGLFFFLDPFNLEMLIKVLDACGINNRYWVFYAATTNVELTLTVTDTQTGRVKVYFNPLNNPAAPVQDTDAFPCS